MTTVFKQSLTLMWQGMGAIFVVILIIFIVLSLFPKIFKNNK